MFIFLIHKIITFLNLIRFLNQKAEVYPKREKRFRNSWTIGHLIYTVKKDKC